MSICRLDDNCQVYMYWQDGKICCNGCLLTDRDEATSILRNVLLDTPEKAIRHLKNHIKQGHLVPDEIFEKLGKLK